MNSSAASTLREARLRAALTQTELADLAGVAQSVVSAYESGKREPGYDTLRRLVSAAGFDLATTLTASTPKSRLQTLVDRHRAKLIRELRAQGASNIRLFGSVARGEDRPDSDVDLLVDVDNSVTLWSLGRMRSAAERILRTSVDVVPANSLKPDVAEVVLAEAVPL